MFNNPLKKYQQGGQVSQEEQQMLAAFVEWLPKRVKEFQGMQPEQIVEALNGMSKSPEGQKQVQAYMQQFQKEMQNSKTGMFKDGGKLQDFICKHVKGGYVAGCGCNPIKGDKGIPGGMPATDYGYRVINRPNRPALEQLMDEDGSVAATRMINGADTTLTIPSKRGDMPLILSNNLRGANAPGKWMMKRMGEPGIMVEPRGASKSWNADFDAAKASVQTEEDGGKVEKHQQNNGKGRGTIAEQDDFSVGKKYWTNNADGSTQSDQYAVRPNGIAVRQRIVDRSHMLDRDQLPVRDTVNVIGLMQDNGVFAPDYDAEIIYGAHPYFQNNAWSTVRREEDGGVLKGQNSIPGGMPEPDPSVFGTLKQGKSRSAVSKAIDDNSKARHFVEGVKKFGNSTMVRLPATGLAAYAAFNVGSLPAVQSIGEVAPYLAKYVVFPALPQMRPKFLLNTMNPMGNVQNPTWHDTFWAVPSDNVMDKNNL